ncbi:spore protein [Cohnella thailandensis]|uniref:Spore protein n=1 Tax=Cohnella thailandensis TaxID=557557 RepID=A0A841T6N8_9BACL|nr:spore protein [Cohnella thailandensis]MBB6637958.1 spore protein [Cohnella thailandensis]MBP1976903.1 hypothetical protein [Cohnella thailandensis]
MPNPQGPAPLGRKSAGDGGKNKQPEAPGFDKKLDGPNRPST